MAEFEPASFDIFSDFKLSRPALLFGPSGSARSDAADLMRNAGLRLADVDLLDGALTRLERHLAVGLVWVETGGEEIDAALLARLAGIAQGGPGRLVVSVASSQIDAFFATLGEADAQILIDATTIERAGALAVALAEREAPTKVSDVGHGNAVHGRLISDELGRIAATLARLSTGPEQSPVPAIVPFSVPQEVPCVNAEIVNSVIRARRMRAGFFNEGLFADPAWDMLLGLLKAEIAQERVPASSLCIAASVPPTIALRWINSMIDGGLFVRHADPNNERSVFIELAPIASAAMRRYFGELSKVEGVV